MRGRLRGRGQEVLEFGHVRRILAQAAVSAPAVLLFAANDAAADPWLQESDRLFAISGRISETGSLLFGGVRVSYASHQHLQRQHRA